jgi:hypothetical protein
MTESVIFYGCGVEYYMIWDLWVFYLNLRNYCDVNDMDEVNELVYYVYGLVLYN